MKISLDDLANDASLYLHSIDFQQRRALFYKVDASVPATQCELARQSQPLAIPLDALLGQMDWSSYTVEFPVHFVWMTDFCGSTLYAKALNEVPGFYLYNEPQLFCDLANLKRTATYRGYSLSDEQWRALLKMALFYLRKTFAAGDIALVKEWPASNYLIHDILSVSESSRAVFMYSGLEDYLGACLKYDSRRETARARVANMFLEMSSIDALKGLSSATLSDAQVVAAHWLYLMYWHQQNDYASHPRLRTLYNNDFFAERADVLCRSADYFGMNLDAEDAQGILGGPVFSRHSKESRAFSMAMHQASLAATRQQFATEIDEGLVWARQIISRFPLAEQPGQDLLGSG